MIDMIEVAPPCSPPRVALADDDGMANLRMRLCQVWCSIATVLATTWCMSLGAIPGIIAIVIAKHVLVAILLMGLGVDARREIRT
jgi:hypothetical protein